MHPLSASSEDLHRAKFAHVLGNPVSHSLSPRLHNAAYAYLDLPFQYSAIEADESECLELINKLRDGEVFGLSFTMPFKEVAFASAEVRSQLVDKSRSANTMVYRRGELTAENTDVYGITQTLIRAAANFDEPWTVIGTGATARSAICALQELGVANISVVGRNESRLNDLVDLYGVTPNYEIKISESNLISTIPMSAQSEMSDFVVGTKFLLDVTYGSTKSHFSRLVNHNGGRVISGVEMLVHQAVMQIEIMTGQSIPAEILFAALPN